MVDHDFLLHNPTFGHYLFENYNQDYSILLQYDLLQAILVDNLNKIHLVHLQYNYYLFPHYNHHYLYLRNNFSIFFSLG